MPRSQSKRHSRRSSADATGTGGPSSDDPPVDDKLPPPDDPSLRASYREAVACLVQCESLIGDLESQLSKKDAHIAQLEERLVQMSLELAKAKAVHDERSLQYTSYRRSVSRTDTDEDDEGGLSQSSPALGTNHWGSPERRGSSGWGRPERRGSGSSFWGRRSGNSNSSDDAECPSVAETVSASWTSQLDESSTSHLSMNIGGLFRRTSDKQDARLPTTKMANKKLEPHGGKGSIKGDEGERPRRRPSNKRRTELNKSSRSFLEESGVVFPSTFEDVVIKGCTMEANSSTKAHPREPSGR